MSFFDEEQPKPFIAMVYRDDRVNMTEEQRQAELNNLDRHPVTEDFEDSPFADRV